MSFVPPLSPAGVEGSDANRVSGAGRACVAPAAPATENTRRSTCRGTSAPSTSVGTVEDSTGSCATKRCGAAATSACSDASSAAEHVGPWTAPRPP